MQRKILIAGMACILLWLAIITTTGCVKDKPMQSSVAPQFTSNAAPDLNPPPTLASPVINGSLQNFVEFAPGLFRGKQPDKAAMQQLKNMGIKTVINLRTSNDDEKYLSGLGMRYVRIPIFAFLTNDKQIVSFLRVVTVEDFKPAFVHCQHGSDRTGMMVAAYRICVQNWTNERAIEELRNFGFHTIYYNIRDRLEDLDRTKILDAVGKEPAPTYKIP